MMYGKRLKKKKGEKESLKNRENKKQRKKIKKNLMLSYKKNSITKKL
jgi:hypothetical protein